jgi:CheY-like chemotaxis protein
MGEKALVVDDNSHNILLEKDLLEVTGFEVFVAEDAAGGIAIAKREKPDIIIMDMRLCVVPKPLRYYAKTKKQEIFPLFL